MYVEKNNNKSDSEYTYTIYTYSIYTCVSSPNRVRIKILFINKTDRLILLSDVSSDKFKIELKYQQQIQGSLGKLDLYYANKLLLFNKIL